MRKRKQRRYKNDEQCIIEFCYLNLCYKNDSFIKHEIIIINNYQIKVVMP